MNIDKNGLPVQSNGNANDQLQRVGMIVASQSSLSFIFDGHTSLQVTCINALARSDLLQPFGGLYVRTPGDNLNNCSADQIISAAGAWLAVRANHCARATMWRTICRFGFAQNTRDGLSTDDAWKLPDFMWFRAAPLFARSLPYLLCLPIAMVADLYLIPIAVGAILSGRESPNNVDNNVTCITLAMCRKIRPTPWSILASWIFGRFLPPNYGSTSASVTSSAVVLFAAGAYANAPVYGSLRWYHRAEAGGNPEIAQMWKPICDELWGP